VGDLEERLALLFTLADRLDGVSEEQDGQHVDILWDAQERFDLGQVLEADPI
jgi:hypothetical protein